MNSFGEFCLERHWCEHEAYCRAVQRMTLRDGRADRFRPAMCASHGPRVFVRRFRNSLAVDASLIDYLNKNGTPLLVPRDLFSLRGADELVTIRFPYSL